MRRLFHTIAFRLRQYAWIVRARIRTLWWKMLGMKVGAWTLLPPIRATWPHQVSIGARCLLEDGIFFRFDGPWREGPAIVIGDRVFIGTGCEFNIQRGIVIGNHAQIASGCRFIDHDHELIRPDPSAPPVPEQTRHGAITLGESSWIGVECVILRGVTIGRGAIIGAGAVVTKSVGDYEIWAGVPARKIGMRPE
jgi:acetyltransferase-like isoleucine patch superfamily enzyme